jgi:hypothetical protein
VSPCSSSRRAALALPLQLVYIPHDATNEVYESRMAEALRRFQQGITEMAFRDLFLAHIREYRERWLSRIGMRATAIDRDILACYRGRRRQPAAPWGTAAVHRDRARKTQQV